MGCTGSTTMIKEQRVEAQTAANKQKPFNTLPPVKVENRENNNSNVLQANKNVTNVNNSHTPQKMTKSVTQDQLIQQVKSEVYDDLMKQALFEVDKDTSVFKL